MRHKLINDMAKILNDGTEQGEIGNFILEREAEGRITKVKVSERDLFENPHEYDYVYSPGAYKIIREAIDNTKIQVWSVSQFSLKIGLSTSALYQNSTRCGIMTYKTFKRMRDFLKPYKKILKNWESFVDIRLVPRGIRARQRHAYHANVAAFVEPYNAGFRKIEKMRGVVLEVSNTFTDQDNGLFVKALPEEGVVIHNMGIHFSTEPLAPFVADAKRAEDKSVTNRGIVYAVTGKCN